MRAVLDQGGTCAAMLGFLYRFSVDLDFDVLQNADEPALREVFHQVFDQLGFSVTLEFDKVSFFSFATQAPRGRGAL